MLIENDLPLELQSELKAMSCLSDNALWQIAGSRMNPDKAALYDIMLNHLKNNRLTSEKQSTLNQLRNESQTLTLKKVHAYVLLQKRGHTLPSLADLKHSSNL